MSKYIDAEKLKSIIKVQIKERKEWLKDIDRSDRQDQLWSDLNGEDMSVLHTITSLQQEQPEMDLEKEICEYFEGWRINYYSETEELLKTNGCTVAIDDVKDIARYFYELGLKAKKGE